MKESCGKKTARRSRRLLAALAVVQAALLAGMGAYGGGLDLPLQRYTLDNGLRVVLCPDECSPTIAVAVFYDVGGRVEEKGRSGFAHLFEHMMFQGSENVPKGGHFTIISSHGGSFNGSTGEDYTNYFEELPAPMLPVALWLEADRMRSLKVDKGNFENQRAVVIEEKLQNYDNEPYVPSFLEINRISYEGWWPYEHSVIGDMKDIKGAKLTWVQEFFYDYYHPGNAVLAITGSFSPKEARRLVEEYFGDIPPHDDAPSFEPPPFKPPEGEKLRIMYDPLAPLPAFHVTYHIPPMRSPEYYPLKLIAMALGDGESSRLYQELVKKRGAVQELYVDVDGRKGPDLFSVFAILTGKENPAQVKKTLYGEIGSIAEKGMPGKELQKVKNRIKLRYLENITSNLSLALMLGKYEILWGNAGEVASEVDRYTVVTGTQIREAARTYLVKKNRTVLDVLPSEKDGGS